MERANHRRNRGFRAHTWAAMPAQVGREAGMWPGRGREGQAQARTRRRTRAGMGTREDTGTGTGTPTHAIASTSTTLTEANVTAATPQTPRFGKPLAPPLGDHSTLEIAIARSRGNASLTNPSP